MIIGQVMYSFGGGGAQRSAVNLAFGLKSLGHDVRLLALGPPGEYAEEISEKLPSFSFSIPRSFLAILNLLSVRRHVIQERYEVLHVHGSGSLPLIAFALLGLRSPPSIHFTWHDSGAVSPGSWIKKRITEWAAGRCATITASSRDVAGRLCREMAIGRVSVLRNCVPDFGAPTEAVTEETVVIWAGRIVPMKRPEWFIRAAVKAKELGISARFLLAGSPLERHSDYYESLKRTALDTGASIEFLGWVDHVELIRQHGAGTIGTQSSTTEGLSMVLLEQMMAGLAIVATDVGDTREALEDGEAGILVGVNDEESFISNIIRLLDCLEEREGLGKRARARAVSAYSCRAIAKHVADDLYADFRSGSAQ